MTRDAPKANGERRARTCARMFPREVCEARRVEEAKFW
jgi:hypothetical protein